MFRDDWRQIVTKAWSVRLIALAFVLTAVETAFAVFGAPVWIRPGIFAALSGLTSAGAFVARLYAQPVFQKDSDNADQ